MIPKIIHQTAKTKTIPDKWKATQEIVRRTYPDWEYRLWTDEDNLNLVKTRYPGLLDIYQRLPRTIMRVDVIRYLIMDTFGGLYLDLDYEFLRKYNFENQELVLPRESEDGDPVRVGNAVFASSSGHRFWKAVIRDLEIHPPTNKPDVLEEDVIQLTGPGFLTKIYRSEFSEDTSITIPHKMAFNPRIPQDSTEYKQLKANSLVYGIHYCHGTWRALTLAERLIDRLRRLAQRSFRWLKGRSHG